MTKTVTTVAADSSALCGDHYITIFWCSRFRTRTVPAYTTKTWERRPEGIFLFVFFFKQLLSRRRALRSNNIISTVHFHWFLFLNQLWKPAVSALLRRPSRPTKVLSHPTYVKNTRRPRCKNGTIIIFYNNHNIYVLQWRLLWLESTRLYP